MGLIRLVGDVLGGGWNAVKGATNSVMWKEYFESGDMSDGVLMKRAEKIIVNGSKNTRSDNNLISSYYHFFRGITLKLIVFSFSIPAERFIFQKSATL